MELSRTLAPLQRAVEVRLVVVLVNLVAVAAEEQQLYWMLVTEWTKRSMTDEIHRQHSG